MADGHRRQTGAEGRSWHLGSAAAVARLRAEVEAFRTHAGPYHPHPAFGRLERDAYADLTLSHASHHLGFLVSRGAASAG